MIDLLDLEDKTGKWSKQGVTDYDIVTPISYHNEILTCIQI